MANYSKQREEIIEIIKGLYNHPTAENIYFLVKQIDSAVSRSTVYRNLSFLVKKGIITQIAVSNGPDRYEYIKNKERHIHSICTKCGKIYEFFNESIIEELKENITKQTKMDIFEDGIVIKGVCESCKKVRKLILGGL